MSDGDRELLKLLRQAFLLIVDVIERKLEMEERTADLRKRVKELARLQDLSQNRNLV